MAKGSLTQARPGVWRMRVVVGYRDNGDPKQKMKTFHGTKKQAETALAEWQTENRTGTTLEPTDTLNVFLNRWMEHIEGDRSPTTMQGYVVKLKNVREALGGVKLSDLTAQQLDRTYAGWRKNGMSAANIDHIHRVLAAALHQAEKWGLVTRAVTDLTSPPRWERPQVAAVQSELVVGMIEEARRRDLPVLAAAIVLSATTGARRGELCGLKWSDLDGQTLHIRRAVKEVNGQALIVGDTKTHQVRRITVDVGTLAVLAEHRELVETAARNAHVKRAANPYMFTLDPAGREPWKPASYSQAFERCTWATCPDRSPDCHLCSGTGRYRRYPITLHQLRHFAATHAIGAGVDPRTVAGRLGHADASTTLRVYSHFLPEQDGQAASVLGGLVVPTLPVVSTK
jgi:integrase